MRRQRRRRRQVACSVAAVLLEALIQPSATAVPVETSGLVVTSGTLQVQSVSSPSSWVPATTVYEGSPVRLVLGIDASGNGTVLTTVSLPGVSHTVGSATTSVAVGPTSLTVPLDLSYGAWLSDAQPNTADHLDVNVTFIPTPPTPSPNPLPDAPPTPPPYPLPSATPTPSSTGNPASTPSEPAVAIPEPPKLRAATQVVIIGSGTTDRRAVRSAIDTMPPGATVMAVLSPSASSARGCPTRRQLRRMIASVAQASGRSVVVRTGVQIRGRCARLELSAPLTPRAGLMAPRRANQSWTTTLTVPVEVVPRPLILVHGMWSTASIWTEYTKAGGLLATGNPRWRGYAVSTMATGSAWFPYAPVNTIEQNAELAWAYIESRMIELNAHEVDVVGHSLGGVITRRMLHDPRYGAAARDAIRAVVLLGTPNGGSSCSDAWAVPANRELTHSSMEAFNLQYPGYPEVTTTSLYADHFGSTCFDSNAGDLFVPSWSTQAQPVNVVRRISPGVQHADMPGDARLFREYVLPALALASAPPLAGPTAQLTNPNAASTRLFEGSEVGAAMSIARTVTIESGRSLVVSVVTDAGATAAVGYATASGLASVPLEKVGGYPVFEAQVSYADLGGTGGPVQVPVTITGSSSAASPEWRWSLATRTAVR